jgi:hypothetical protein
VSSSSSFQPSVTGGCPSTGSTSLHAAADHGGPCLKMSLCGRISSKIAQTSVPARCTYDHGRAKQCRGSAGQQIAWLRQGRAVSTRVKVLLTQRLRVLRRPPLAPERQRKPALLRHCREQPGPRGLEVERGTVEDAVAQRARAVRLCEPACAVVIIIASCVEALRRASAGSQSTLHGTHACRSSSTHARKGRESRHLLT